MADDTEQGNIGTLETRKDAGEGQPGVLKFWLMELHAADKLENDFRDNGVQIDERYEAEEAWSLGGATGSGRTTMYGADGRQYSGVVSHNILYSNVQTMLPALYDSTPLPDIRRRFRDVDPIGKQVSEILERAVSHQVEMNDFDAVMENVILDHLLPGRGLARLNYEPTFKTIPEQQVPAGFINGETGEDEFITEPERDVIVDERVNVIYVPWTNFRVSPAKTWEDVRWISFDWYLTKEQTGKMFPGKDIPLDTQTAESFHKDQEFSKVPSVFKRAYVREIWDKKKRQVVFIAPSFKEGPLRTDDDPLQLEGFFPMPRPIYSVKKRKSMIPVPDFFQYASQAFELDMITKRIQGLIKGLRLRGAYDAALTEMQKIQTLGDNEYTPLENANQWRDKGGLVNAVFTMPIEEAAKVLAQLYLQRDQIKDTIFEITGLSDIVRGVSDPNETLGAQQIKTQFGSLRINRRQREVQRYARDIIRLMVEIIAEHFQPETLEKITQKQITPQVMQVIKSDQLRSYRIDIETDSTIARQLQDEEENYTKLLNSISQFVQGIAPLVVQGFFPLEVAVSLLQSGIRRFKMGRSVEDAFEQIDIEGAKAAIQQNQNGGDPKDEAKTREVEQKLLLEGRKMQGKQQMDAAKLQLERQKAAAQLKLQRDKAAAELNVKSDIEGQKIQASAQSGGNGQFDTSGTADETFEQVITAMAEMVQSNQQMSELMVMATQQMAQGIKEMSKPKMIIKDEGGRPIGIEPVDDI